MFTLRCTLKLPSGQQVEAVASSESPDSETLFAYSGAVEVLPRRFASGQVADLRVLFGNLARELHGELVTSEEGEYSVWAE